MSFILSNNGKIKLIERFILQEDDAIYSTADNYCTKILDFIKDRIIEAENKSGENSQNIKVFKDIKQKTNELLNRIEKNTALILKSKDNATVKALTVQYVDDVEALLLNLDPDSAKTEQAEVKKILGNIKTEARSSKLNQKTLKDSINAIMAALDEAITNSSGITSGSKDDKIAKVASSGDYILNLQNTYNDVAKIRTMANKNDSGITDALVLELRKLYDKASVDTLVDFMD